MTVQYTPEILQQDFKVCKQMRKKFIDQYIHFGERCVAVGGGKK
jgi:hypothetical protein